MENRNRTAVTLYFSKNKSFQIDMSKNSNNHKISSNIVNQLNTKHQTIQPSTNSHIQPTIQSQQPHTQAHYSVPPRYQPPPQPPGGILKNIPSSKTVSSGFADTHTVQGHINLKYPPEVPKLTTVYIPDGVRTVSSSSSKNNVPQRPLNNHRQYHQQANSQIPQHQQQQQQQHRLSLEEDQLNRLQAVSGGTQVIQHQQQDMLKFVRKTDSEASAATGASSNSAAQARLSAEQNRHLQVPILLHFS